MSMTIQSSIKEKLLIAPNEVTKEENTPAEMRRSLNHQMEKKGDRDILTFIREADKMYYDLRDMYWWPGMKKDIATYLGMRLDMSTDYHPQTDGTTERRDYSEFEEIYHSKYSVCSHLKRETTDKVVLIKERLKAANDRQKSYADNRRKPLEFEVGDRVLLKVSHWKGAVRFGKKGKLAPRYVGRLRFLKE
ncbi:putative reverse transcriptase domain-containing protein [Tanacetum coccineum]|uniref:Reverse transcriptase domain-containing protein n=1 Tax=Tanacetum coccineum TaxID=301880 RepID=A0ABQ5E8A7_9ASTR